MQLLKRFGYFFIGLSLGSLAVLFFWKQKEVRFDYGMDARTLKTIRIRKRLYSEKAKEALVLHKIDTAQISTILLTGDVDFSRSKPRERPCASYYVTSDTIDLYVIRCDSTSTIENITLN